MSSAVVGGAIGAAVTRELEARYGKARVTFGAGVVAILVGLGLAILYFVVQPAVLVTALNPVEVTVTRFEMGRSSLNLWSGDQHFTARASLWRPSVGDEHLESALRHSTSVTIWLNPGSNRIFGITAGALRIEPDEGVREYMSGRFWLMALWAAFLVMGAAVMGRGAWLIRHDESRTGA